MTQPIIISRSNPKVKQIRSLQQRKYRQRELLFVVEGIRHVGEAIEANAPIEYICYAPKMLTSNFGQELIQANQHIETVAVSNDLMEYLAGKDNPQGMLAVVREQDTVFESITPHDFQWGVALVAPQDPGNIGTILRTIDAVGADGLILLENSADVYHPTAVRASMGTIFWKRIIRSSFAAFSAWAIDHQYHIYGTSIRGAIDYQAVQHYHLPRILLMGSEREGLTQSQIELCTQLIRLPMHGHATSLNLSVATGVMLYDMLAKNKSSV